MAGVELDGIVEWLPHHPPMRLVDEVVAADDRSATCRARIGEDHLLLEEGHVSPLLAIELFAQTAAALMVHRALGAGAEAPRSGMLLGTRKVEMSAGRFEVGDELTISVEEVWGSGPLAQFDCRLERDGEVVARGSINVAETGP